MSTATTVRAASVVLGGTVVLAVALLVATWGSTAREPDRVFAVAVAGVGAVVAAIGLVVARLGRLGSGNGRVALLTQACGLAPVVATLIDTAAVAGGPGTVVARADGASWLLHFVPAMVLALCFPDGRPARRWTALVVAWPALPVVAALLLALGGEDVGGPVVLAIVPLLLLTVLALALRYRSADQEQRRVLWWLFASASLAPVAMAVADVGFALTGAFDVAGIAVLVVPACVTLAVAVTALPVRLSALDRALARFLLTVAMILSLAAVVGIVLLGCVVVRLPYPATGIVPAIAAAAAFAPALVLHRRWIQRVVLPRRRRALRLARDFVSAVRDGLAPAEEVEQVLRDATGDDDLELRFTVPDGSPQEGPARSVAVLAGRHHIADVLPGPFGEADERDLREVLRELRLPIEVTRLRVDLARSVREVEESRGRLLVAADGERRRLGRDLHDGPQQALVALGMDLQSAQRRIDRGETPDADIARALEVTRTAIVELRRLAQGVSPADLEAGLPAALRAMVAKVPVGVELDVPDGDLPEPARSTAYFVASEALTNALKHAGASHIAIAGRRAGAVFRMRVTDDGIGGAAPVAGSGLAGLRDRVAAAGGRWSLQSPPGAGTVVEVELPCGS